MNFVNINGEPWRPQVHKRQSSKPKAANKEAPDRFHKGFIVEGHPPGALEAARESAEKAVADWESLPEKVKAKFISEGSRAPKPWAGDEVWLAATKRKKVRSKPYQLAQAADECKALAERAGWLCVRVVPLTRGEP